MICFSLTNVFFFSFPLPEPPLTLFGGPHPSLKTPQMCVWRQIWTGCDGPTSLSDSNVAVSLNYHPSIRRLESIPRGQECPHGLRWIYTIKVFQAQCSSVRGAAWGQEAARGYRDPGNLESPVFLSGNVIYQQACGLKVCADSGRLPWRICLYWL